jgi:hypothetical protein
MTPDESAAALDGLIEAARRLLDGLQALRAGMPGEPGSEPDQGSGPEDEFPAYDLIDTATASERFNIPIDTVRWLCRTKGLGQKQGKNRWLASVTAFRRYMERS